MSPRSANRPTSQAFRPRVGRRRDRRLWRARLVPTLRHSAKEGRIFVVGVTACIRDSDVPTDLPGATEIYDDPDGFLSRGNTTIVAPGGKILEGPLVAQEGTVTATLDLARIAAGRRSFDPVGHYARPDVLTLTDATSR